MKKYFIHEKADFIDDEEAVTDFDDLKDRDIDNDGDVDDSDEYLHKRLGTIAKMDEEEELDEMSTTAAVPGYQTPFAFDDEEMKDSEVEKLGYKKAPKTNKYFKPMEGKSTFKKMMAEMYGLKEATSIDIQHAVRAIRDYNRSVEVTDIEIDDLAVDILAALGYKPTSKNIDATIDHLGASSDGYEVPADPDMVRELYPMLEAVKYDIEAALRDIRSFNRDTGELPNEEYLARQVVRDLGFRPTRKNVEIAKDHLGASAGHDLEIPEDPSIIKELIPMLSEAVSYREFKKDPNSTPKQKVNKGIAEVNKMLSEMEKIVNNNLRLKQETGVDSSHFWKSTGKRFAKINERMTRISNRLKELSK